MYDSWHDFVLKVDSIVFDFCSRASLTRESKIFRSELKKPMAVLTVAANLRSIRTYFHVTTSSMQAVSFKSILIIT